MFLQKPEGETSQKKALLFKNGVNPTYVLITWCLTN
jgi:hypothetical protein